MGAGGSESAWIAQLRPRTWWISGPGYTSGTSLSCPSACILLAPWAQTREHPRRGPAGSLCAGTLGRRRGAGDASASGTLLHSGLFPINSPVHLLLFARCVRVCQSDLISWIKNPLKRFSYPRIHVLSLGTRFHWPGPAEEPEPRRDSSCLGH